MNLILDFIKSFLYECIFLIIFSSGAIILYLKKIKNIINLKSLGINYIYKKGHNLKKTLKVIKKSRQIKIIAFMPYSFVFDYKEILIEQIKAGCNINILICAPNSLLLKELSQIERHTDNDISMQYSLLINLLKSIKTDAGNNSFGSIEVRTYNTEIRNPAIICSDEHNHKTAFVSLSAPPLRSIDTIMLEYTDENCNFIINYFDSIWDNHSFDVVLKL